MNSAPTFKIRQVEAAGHYLDSIRAMDKACFPYQLPLSFDGAYWWIATDADDVPVGYGGLQYMYENLGFLCRSGVLPDARGNGLQRRLVRARERGARGMGWTRLVTYTAPENVVSANNLIACGYRLYRPAFTWAMAGALYFERQL